MDIAQKQIEARAAAASVGGKRADLSAAQATAEATTLRSPLSGIVVRRLLNAGDMADPATPVVEVADTRLLDLIGKLPAEDAAKIHSGMAARVTTAGAPNRIIPGRVVSVGQVDPETGLADVRIRIASAAGIPQIGAFAGADIVVSTDPSAVVVPKDAVVTRGGKAYVFVVGRDGVAHEQRVTVGVEQESVTEIVRGVAEGDEVIRLGQYELTDGAKVQAAKHKG